MPHWLKVTLHYVWFALVRGSPYYVVFLTISLAFDIWFHYSPAWLAFESVVLILNIIAFDFRRRHGTLPKFDDDFDDLPPPPKKGK